VATASGGRWDHRLQPGDQHLCGGTPARPPRRCAPAPAPPPVRCDPQRPVSPGVRHRRSTAEHRDGENAQRDRPVRNGSATSAIRSTLPISLLGSRLPPRRCTAAAASRHTAVVHSALRRGGAPSGAPRRAYPCAARDASRRRGRCARPCAGL